MKHTVKFTMTFSVKITVTSVAKAPAKSLRHVRLIKCAHVFDKQFLVKHALTDCPDRLPDGLPFDLADKGN